MKKVEATISWSGDNFCAHAEIEGIVIDTNKSFEKLRISFLDTLAFHLDGGKDGYEVDFVITGSAFLKLNEERIKRSTIGSAPGTKYLTQLTASFSPYLHHRSRPMTRRSDKK